MDYMIADETVIPPESRPYYTEKIIHMPHSYFVNDHKQVGQSFTCIRPCFQLSHVMI